MMDDSKKHVLGITDELDLGIEVKTELPENEGEDQEQEFHGPGDIRIEGVYIKIEPVDNDVKDLMRTHVPKVEVIEEDCKMVLLDQVETTWKSLHKLLSGSEDCTNPEYLACIQCSYKTTSTRSFWQHTRRAHQYALSIFECDYCPFRTYTQHGLYAHIYDTHPEVPPKALSWMQCGDCSYRTTAKRFLNRHRSKVHKRKVNSTKHVFQEDTKPPVDTTCLHCCYEAEELTGLKLHQKLFHRGTYWWKCDKCSYGTNVAVYLDKHKEKAHKIRSWLCHECSSTFSAPQLLRSHLGYKHTETDAHLRLFECSKCPYKSKFKNSLSQHIIARHMSREECKMFRCTECSYESKRRDNLRTHVLTKHTPDDAIKWHRCVVCPYKAKLKVCLQEHQLRNHPTAFMERFECSKCSYKAKTKSSLANHVRVKHGRDSEQSGGKSSKGLSKVKAKAALVSHTRKTELRTYTRKNRNT